MKLEQKRKNIDNDIGVRTALNLIPLQERNNRHGRATRIDIGGTNSGLKTIVRGLQKMHRKEKKETGNRALVIWLSAAGIAAVLGGIAAIVYILAQP